jgi:TPR repeat protein
MLNKMVLILLFIFLTIAPAYSASPEQPNSVSLDPNLLQDLIDKANKGDPNAQYSLGEMNYFRQNYKEAFKWITMVAEKGYADAQCRIGLMYSDGKGVQQDYNEAFKWLTK